MSIQDLSAKELARVDSVCLDYEDKLRRGEAVSIDELVKNFGGRDADVLRTELEAVRAEVEEELSVTPAPKLGAVSGVIDVAVELPKSGESIGPYVLGEVLGRGGMGTVFQARDIRLNRWVAIKLLSVTGSQKRALADRFQREAKAVARLSHPNIVELFDVGVASGVPYAVMEYLHGVELADRFQGEPIEAGEVRRIGAQIADALASAHAGGVIHRDLKPQNIMLVERQVVNVAPTAEDGVDDVPTTIVKLVDFGLSRQPSDLENGEPRQPLSETREGTILGTPGYMAPEQARGETVTASADLFSLGCVLYEAFYGHRAFDGVTAAARFASVLETTPSGDTMRREADPALAAIIDQCLAKSIAARPRSAAVVARELRLPVIEDDQDQGPWLDRSTRRRFMESIAGGFIGALAGHGFRVDHSVELGSIQRIAVVSLSDKIPVPADADLSTATKIPIGQRVMTPGEELAGMLAQELNRIPNLVVRPYRPIAITSPDEFKSLGRELFVDAVVTGLYNLDRRGSKTFVTITLEMISTSTGNPIWSETLVAEKAESLLDQTELVRKLAGAINRRLMPLSSDQDRPETVETFGCLAKGHTYLDPDNTVEGLEMAVRCFEHAITIDGRYPDAHAGLALTLLALATRGGEVEPSAIQQQIERARVSYGFARELSPQAYDVRLAGAELDWQTFYRYDDARVELQSLASQRPNDWRVHHQLGLLQLSSGNMDAARSELFLASQLHPQSILVRTDRARLEWFAGNQDRSVSEATELLRTFPTHILAKGLLIDIYEQAGDFERAAKVLTLSGADLETQDSRKLAPEYFSWRATTIAEVPYGPFNGLMNQAILSSRVRAIDEVGFEQLASSLSPSLPMLVAQHPALRGTQSFDRAKLLLSGGFEAAAKPAQDRVN